MKKLIIALAALMVSVAAYGQGEVVFNNKVGTEIVARVTFPDGTGVGEGFTAQLFGGPAGTAVDKLTALTPTTTFRTTSEAAKGFVNQVIVQIPGVAAGANATLVMRAFNGATFASSSVSGSSSPITIATGGQIPGGAALPPTNLTGLQAFTVVPEPSTIALALAGAGLLLFRRRK
jgi:hypothetical protein